MKFTAQTDKFQDLTYALDKILYQGFLEVNEEGLTIKQPDSSNHSMVKIDADKDFFESFDVEEPEKLGVNYESLHSLTKNANSETITIEKVENKFKVSFGDKTFEIPILNLEEFEDFKLQELELESEYKVNLEDFVDAVETMFLVGAEIEFIHDRQKLRLESNSDTHSGEVSMLLTDYTSNRTSTLIDENKIDDYNKVLSKIIDSDKDLKVRSGDQKPLHVDVDAYQNLRIQFVIAPRIPER